MLLFNTKAISIKYIIHGAIRSLLMNIFLFLFFFFVIRLLAANQVIENYLFTGLNQQSLAVVLKIFVFGVPFIFYFVMSIIRRQVKKKLLFWLSGTVIQFILLLTISPNFDM